MGAAAICAVNTDKKRKGAKVIMRSMINLLNTENTEKTRGCVWKGCRKYGDQRRLKFKLEKHTDMLGVYIHFLRVIPAGILFSILDFPNFPKIVPHIFQVKLLVLSDKLQLRRFARKVSRHGMYLRQLYSN